MQVFYTASCFYRSSWLVMVEGYILNEHGIQNKKAWFYFIAHRIEIIKNITLYELKNRGSILPRRTHGHPEAIQLQCPA